MFPCADLRGCLIESGSVCSHPLGPAVGLQHMFAQDRDGQFGTGIRSERPLVACNTDSLLLPHWELLRGVLGGGAVEMHQGFTAELKHGHAALKPLAQALCHWPLAQGLKPDSSSNLMTWQLAFLVWAVYAHRLAPSAGVNSRTGGAACARPTNSR